MHPKDPHNIGAALEELIWYRRLTLTRRLFSLIAVFSGIYLIVTSIWSVFGAERVGGLAEVAVPFSLCAAVSVTILFDHFFFWQHEI